MARRILTTDFTDKSPGLKFMYLVDTPVGKGADNKRIADVQLVQLFLNEFYSANTALFKKLRKPGGRNEQVILLDGIVGGQTIDGIVEFQKDAIRSGASAVIVDGRVSVPTGLRVAGTNHIFTIFQLNLFFFNTSAENLSFDGNLENHPVVQGAMPELAAELSLQKVLANLAS